MHLETIQDKYRQTNKQKPCVYQKANIFLYVLLDSDSLSPTSLKNYSKQDKTHIFPIFSTHLFDENYTVECGILLLFYGSL